MNTPSRRRLKRLDWALKGRVPDVLLALERDRSGEAQHLKEGPGDISAETVARLIMDQADPTGNKRFTPWLVREYAEGRLILEDLGTANETLALFQRYAPRLKPEQRDIQRYSSLAAAWEVVRRFAERDEAQSNKAQKALDRAKAYEESRILRQDPDGFTVAVPLTEFAAKWWGKGTRWCTAAEKNNQFWEYHRQAPLIVLVVPEVGKLQMWVTDLYFEFMDAVDRPVSSAIKRKLWRWIEPLLLINLKTNGQVLRAFPAEHRTPALCWAAMRQHGRALEWVPEALRTYEIHLAAVKRNGFLLASVHSEHRTHELCLAAVQQSGHALYWVPDEYRTAQIYLAAVQQNGRALEWVPEELQTQDICLEAVKAFGKALQWVPKKNLTYEICLAAVRQSGGALEWVPEEHLTQGLCLAAVQQDGGALEWVLEEHRTQELYLAAVRSSGMALQWVPEEYLTAEMILSAVQQNGLMLQVIPEVHRTPEIFLSAVMQDSEALRWVPEEARAYNLCLAAIRQNGAALQWVPEEHRTYELCLEAVRQNEVALQYLPSAYRTHEIYLAALVANRLALEFIPDHLHGELLAKLPPRPAPAVAWDIELLDTWAEKLQADSNQLRVRHA